MKIAYPDFNSTIEFKKKEIVSIVIEDAVVFESFIMKMWDQIEKRQEYFVFSKENEICDISKVAVLICSPKDLHFSERTIQKNLFKELCDDIFTGTIMQELTEFYSRISQMLEKLKLESNYNLDYKNDMSATEVLKAFEVHIQEPEGTFTERFLDYATAMHKLTNTHIFVLANCDAYLRQEDYRHLEKWVQYEDTSIIFVRNQQLELNIRQNEYIIDSDFCEIH